MVQISQWFQLYVLMYLLWVYSVVFIYWLIDCIYWLAPSSEFYISWTSHLFARTVSFLQKCYDVHTNANTQPPSLPFLHKYSILHTADQYRLWFEKHFSAARKKKSPCVKSTVSLAKKKHLGLPWRPVVTALCFQCSGRQFNPGLEAWLPRAAWHSQKENRPQGIKPMYKDALCDTIYNNRNKGDNKFKNSKLTKYLTQWETMKPEKERNEIDL